jgi:hypothetical protein
LPTKAVSAETWIAGELSDQRERRVAESIGLVRPGDGIVEVDLALIGADGKLDVARRAERLAHGEAELRKRRQVDLGVDPGGLSEAERERARAGVAEDRTRRVPQAHVLGLQPGDPGQIVRVVVARRPLGARAELDLVGGEARTRTREDEIAEAAAARLE